MRKHKTWSEIRDEGLRRPAARRAYDDARLAYEIGRQVREIREAHGLSQGELAHRMGTTQSAELSRRYGHSNALQRRSMSESMSNWITDAQPRHPETSSITRAPQPRPSAS
jgi:ribosome-binding protein aMBF1 (putative translation factor)